MQPKDIRIYFEGQSDEIEARWYTFNEEYDIILLFGKGVFLALNTITPNSDTYPKLLHDFKSIKSENESSLKGYIMTKTTKGLKLQVIMK